MKNLLRINFLRAPDGGGSGGGDPAPAGDGGAPVASPPAASGGDGSQPAEESAPNLPKDPPAGDEYFPDGLPDTMKGKNSRETMDKMAEALNGYRQRDAKADIPKDPEGYLNHEGLEGFEIDDSIKPYFETLKDDGVFKAAAQVASQEKVSRGAFNKMMLAAFSEAQKTGIMEPPIDVAAERAALLPETAKSLPKAEQDKAIDRRMEENEAFIDLLIANEEKRPEGQRRITKEDAEHVKMMLGDSAKGHRFLEFVRSSIAMGGDQPLGRGGSSGGRNEREQLRAELEKPEMQPTHPQFDRAKYDDLMARYQKAIPG